MKLLHLMLVCNFNVIYAHTTVRTSYNHVLQYILSNACFYLVLVNIIKSSYANSSALASLFSTHLRYPEIVPASFVFCIMKIHSDLQ